MSASGPYGAWSNGQRPAAHVGRIHSPQDVEEEIHQMYSEIMQFNMAVEDALKADPGVLAASFLASNLRKGRRS